MFDTWWPFRESCATEAGQAKAQREVPEHTNEPLGHYILSYMRLVVDVTRLSPFQCRAIGFLGYGSPKDVDLVYLRGSSPIRFELCITSTPYGGID